MSLLIYSFRRHDIIRQKSTLNYKLMSLQKKLMDLQSYASKIADGIVSLNDMLEVPASQYNQLSVFMQYSHQMAYNGAQQKFSVMSQVPGSMPQMPNAQLQQQYSQLMFKSLYDQEREKAAEVEKRRLNVVETKIQQEVAQIQTQLQMLESEEKNVTSAEEKAAEASAPKYTA